MRILHIASEAIPWVKTGGLADVVGALCAHLARDQHEVVLALPRYRGTGRGGSSPEEGVAELPAIGASPPSRVVAERTPSGFTVWWVEVPELFDRDGVYGTAAGDYADNALRYATLVRASLAATRPLEWRPDLVHAHDWQGALAPVLVRHGDLFEGGRAPATVLTIHNLAYQGWFPSEAAAEAGLPELEALVQGHGVGLLKGGMLTADRVTTVSPTYAREIATPRFGFGLDPWIADLDPPVEGILNGIDTATWNPHADPHISHTYHVDDLAGKAACKASLQAELGLEVDPDVPLFGMVSRLVGQKGLSLVEILGDELVDRPAQFVFLGTGEPRYERLVAELAERHPNVAAALEFSEGLAHRIEAGADFFLMPSEFEPCGLNQMISQRYGTPPIVHRVGGLADTVTHASPESLDAGEATGVVFEHFDAPALAWAVGHACDLYARPEDLASVRRAGMKRDFSWRRSGLEYERLYRRTIDDAAGSGG